MHPTAFVTCAPLALARPAAVALRSSMLGRALPRAAPARRAVLHAPRIYAMADEQAESASEPEAPAPAPEAAAADAAAPGDDAGSDDAAPASTAEDAAVAAQSEMDGDRPAGERRRRRRSRPKRVVTLPLEDMSVGMELEGTVKSVMGYGAFIGDMGTPTDGLLHVSQLAAGFVENVSDIVKEGEKVKVRVMAIDMDKGTFSLTMKSQEEMEQQAAGRERRAAGGDGRADSAARREGQKKKWEDFSFDPEKFVSAKVTSVTDFGAFCQLLGEDGAPLEAAPTEGLIHISELSSGRVEKVTDVLSVDQAVQVRIVSTDRKRNRISMSLREFGDDSKRDGGGNSEESGNLAEDMASAQENQPEFKTVMEIAFEKAQAKKAAAMAKN